MIFILYENKTKVAEWLIINQPTNSTLATILLSQDVRMDS